MQHNLNSATFGILEYMVTPHLSNPITSQLPEKNDNAILNSSRGLTTFVIDKHKNQRYWKHERKAVFKALFTVCLQRDRK